MPFMLPSTILKIKCPYIKKMDHFPQNIRNIILIDQKLCKYIFFYIHKIFLIKKRKAKKNLTLKKHNTLIHSNNLKKHNTNYF